MKRCIALGTFALAAACAHDLGLMKKQETLNAYRSAIRWSAFDQAAAFQNGVAPPRRASDRLRDIRVSGYETVSEREDKERMTLQQTVLIRYYHLGDLVEKTTVDEQYWHYEPDQGKWVIDSPLPRFE